MLRIGCQGSFDRFIRLNSPHLWKLASEMMKHSQNRHGGLSMCKRTFKSLYKNNFGSHFSFGICSFRLITGFRWRSFFVLLTAFVAFFWSCFSPPLAVFFASLLLLLVLVQLLCIGLCFFFSRPDFLCVRLSSIACNTCLSRLILLASFGDLMIFALFWLDESL